MMLEQLTELLRVIAGTLLVPDILLLLLLLLASVLHLGGIASEAIERLRHHASFRRLVERLKADAEIRVAVSEVPASFGLPRRAFSGFVPSSREKTLDDLQLGVERVLDRLDLGVRIGPVLGLAGTLIPLGPGLVALSAGDLKTLSDSLVVAFATTILGLAISALCFVMRSIRRRWYLQDLSDIEFVTERIDP